MFTNRGINEFIEKSRKSKVYFFNDKKFVFTGNVALWRVVALLCAKSV